MKIQTNYIQCHNQYAENYRISYNSWGNPLAQKVLFCVHGLNRNSRDFDFIAEYFVKLGYYVVAPDLPGRGNSDYLQDPRGYSLAATTADLLHVIGQLQLKNIDFVGVSLGGILGFVLAGLIGDRIRHLILSDIGPEIEAAGIARITAYNSAQPDFADFSAAGDYLRSLSARDGIYDEEVWQHIIINSFQKNAAGRWELKRDVQLAASLLAEVSGAGNVQFWQYWAKLSLPTLVIHGQLSDLLSGETLAKMQESNPATEILSVADIGHSPYLYRSEHFEVIARFLNAL